MCDSSKLAGPGTFRGIVYGPGSINQLNRQITIDTTSRMTPKEAATSIIADLHDSIKPTTNNDPVNHPSHYTSHPSGVECITVTRHMSFNIGNAIKYLWRAGKKDAEVQDLRKAVWYIEDEIKRLSIKET